MLELNKWNMTPFLKVLAAPALLGGTVGLYHNIASTGPFKFGTFAQIAILLCFGLFMVGLGRVTIIEKKNLTRKLKWFGSSIGAKTFPMESFSHVEVRPRSSTHTGGVGGGGRAARYVSMEFIAQGSLPSQDISQHVFFGLHEKGIEELGGFLGRLTRVIDLGIRVDDSIYDKLEELGVDCLDNSIERLEHA